MLFLFIRSKLICAVAAAIIACTVFSICLAQVPDLAKYKGGRAESETGRYWVFFRDKGENQQLLKVAPQDLKLPLSERSIRRRAIRAHRRDVVTIHDLCPFTEFWDRSYFRRKVFKWYFKRAIKKAKKIIAISRNAKKEITDICPDCNTKIEVIYEFVDEKFLRIKDYHNKERLVKDEYILFVGNRKKHKNLSRLILAFNQVKNIFPNLKFVIAGKKDNEIDEIDLLKNRLNLKEKIIEAISPGDEEIINLYKYAKAFIFPSLYEGFGLPPLEAMAIEIPVLASDIPVLKEICGNAAYFFNPYDVEDMAKAICKVVTDESLRRSLIEKGKERVKFFDSESAIDQHVKLYKELSRNWK